MKTKRQPRPYRAKCNVRIFNRYDPEARCRRLVQFEDSRYCWQHTAIANNIDWRGDRR